MDNTWKTFWVHMNLISEMFLFHLFQRQVHYGEKYQCLGVIKPCHTDFSSLFSTFNVRGLSAVASCCCNTIEWWPVGILDSDDMKDSKLLKSLMQYIVHIEHVMETEVTSGAVPNAIQTTSTPKCKMTKIRVKQIYLIN